MKLICEREKCTACAACVQVCPKECIILQEDTDGFLYPYIDENNCVNCGLCKRVCHVQTKHKGYTPLFYMGWHKDVEVLKKSSSGGAFTALADIILKEGGLVFGASFNTTTRKVCHVAIETIEELDRIRLSKYYQSNIGDTYKSVKEELKSRKVLFSGTACQVAGLYTFLGEKNANLITVDVLCHGVTSSKVVDSYIKCKEKKYKKSIKEYRFRLKPNDSDWLEGGVRLDFQDGSYAIQNKVFDTFFVGYNHYLFLRDSCYRCQFAGEKRISDFTLADYWGVTMNETDDYQRKYGVSLILANTEWAKDLVSSLKNVMVIKPINPDNAIVHNQALVKPSTPNKFRNCFFGMVNSWNFDFLVVIFNMKYYFKQKTKSIFKMIFGEVFFYKIVNIFKLRKR